MRPKETEKHVAQPPPAGESREPSPSPSGSGQLPTTDYRLSVLDRHEAACYFLVTPEVTQPPSAIDRGQRFGFRNLPILTLEGVPPEVFLALPFEDQTPKSVVVFHSAFGAHG